MTTSNATSTVPTESMWMDGSDPLEKYAPSSAAHTVEVPHSTSSAATEYTDRTSEFVLRKTFQGHFLRLVEDCDFEYGFSNVAETFVADNLRQLGPSAREWINELFIESFHDADNLVRILRVIAHFPYGEMYPQGMTMAAAALIHRSSAVRECGIRCFENWEDKDSVTILENILCPEAWLKEYVEQVIRDLKGEFANGAVCQED